MCTVPMATSLDSERETSDSNASMINSLKAFPFLDNSSILDGLKEELPSYLAMLWWKKHAEELLVLHARWHLCSQQLLNVSFFFSKLHMDHNRNKPYRITLNVHSCFSTIVNSELASATCILFLTKPCLAI